MTALHKFTKLWIAAMSSRTKTVTEVERKLSQWWRKNGLVPTRNDAVSSSLRTRLLRGEVVVRRRGRNKLGLGKELWTTTVQFSLVSSIVDPLSAANVVGAALIRYDTMPCGVVCGGVGSQEHEGRIRFRVPTTLNSSSSFLREEGEEEEEEGDEGNFALKDSDILRPRSRALFSNCFDQILLDVDM